MGIAKILGQAHLDILDRGTVVSNAAATTAAAPPAGGVGAAAGAWDTAANRDSAIASINNIRIDLDSVQTQLNSLLTVLRTNRLIPQ